MLKNKKGFTIMEILVVCLILTVLAGIGIPKYRVTVRKAQIAANLPLLKAAQEGIINFYNLNGELPTRIFQLPLDRAEFESVSDISARHKRTGCLFSLNFTSKHAAVLNCNKGWEITYNIIPSNLGYTLGQRIFEVKDGSPILKQVAQSYGWNRINGSDEKFLMN